MKTFPLLLAALTLFFSGCAHLSTRETLFQTSSITALMEGGYDGETTCGELLRNGDFGLGTFQALDGEMVVLDGTVWKVRSDGAVVRMPDGERTPFAAVTFFDADERGTVKPGSLDDLKQTIDALLPDPNLIYALRVSGTFPHVKARSVPRQIKPYPRLADAVKNQTVFSFADARGTLIGIRFPDFAAGVNVPGWHFHFIADDRASGGHVLDCTIGSGTFALDATPSFFMILPRGTTGAIPSSDAHPSELERIEKGR